MNQQDRDKNIYSLAREFILGRNIPGVNESILEKYLEPPTSRTRQTSINDIYLRMLESAQNANMKSGVVGGAIGGVSKLGPILCDFDPAGVLKQYTDWQSIFDEIKIQVKPRGKMPRTAKSIWPQYCRTILSAASFLDQFTSVADFYNWLDLLDKDYRTRAALPLVLSQDITGFGYALACDFLKEIGYVNFGKPDVHIRDIFVALEMCPSDAKDYHLLKAVVRVASNSGVTPYNADKVFWLIGSGYFYLDPKVGNNGRVGSRKQEFIRYAQDALQRTKS
jgi:hypothetical protein